MKSALLMLCMTCAAFAVHAQHILKGRVIDKKNREPLIGATVFIHELRTGAATDAHGNYQIPRLPHGKFLVEVKYTSYGNRVFEVSVDSNSTFDVEMESSVAELHEVVVTGVSSSTQAHSNPAPTTIASKQMLLENASTNIIEGLTRKPGIANISTGAAVAKPNIRGLGYNRIVTLYNGVRQEGQQWGDEHGIELDEYAVDRVEIMKGPGSIMYGSDAMGGVLNFITSNPLPDGEVSGDFISNYQTNNGLAGFSLMNAGNLNGFNWNVRLSSKDAGNYSNKTDGTVYNSGFSEKDVSGYIGLNRRWGYSQLHFTSFNQTLAMTEGIRNSSGAFMKNLTRDSLITVSSADLDGYEIDPPYQRVSHHRIFVANQFILGKSRLAATIGYQLSQRREFGDVENKEQYGLYFYMPTWTYDAKFFLPEFNGWKTCLGIGGMLQQNQNKGSAFLVPDYRLSDIGGFITAQRDFKKFHASGGLRYDTRNISTGKLLLDSMGNIDANGTEKFAPVQATYQNYSASAGVSWHVFETEKKSFLFKINVARGLRAPNIAELASNGRHEGTFRYERGNASLKPETSLQLDMGVEYSVEHLTIEINAFQNSIHNYIYTVKLRGTNGSDSISDPAEPVPTYRFAQVAAQLFGGEIRIDVHPHPLDWLHIENTFSLVKGQLADMPDSSGFLPFIPAPKLQSELRGNFKQVGKYLKNVYAKLDMDYYFRQNEYLRENNTETATPSYLLLHAGTGTDVVSKKGTKLFSLYISMNNLLDAAYQNHLSRFKYLPLNNANAKTGVFNMGRNFSVKLVVPLIFKR